MGTTSTGTPAAGARIVVPWPPCTNEQAGRPQQLAVVAEDTHLDTRRARERCRIDGRPGRDDSTHAEVGERPVSRCVPTA
ncbi:hypothetical protein [Agromyces bauzanensis]|uniref:Uncharacterized protein n=1 Tax=Agromyces bauzanensis TaxID=1308924 RepID=A0A917UNH4_9MICO|nr:hypothetical protein GCM10011372_04750 [Agromyces bauzanensis]